MHTSIIWGVYFFIFLKKVVANNVRLQYNDNNKKVTQTTMQGGSKMNELTMQAREMLRYTQYEMMQCTQKQSINSLYAQARVWLRCYYFITSSCSEQMYRYLGNRFKSFRNDARRALK